MARARALPTHKYANNNMTVMGQGASQKRWFREEKAQRTRSPYKNIQNAAQSRSGSSAGKLQDESAKSQKEAAQGSDNQ